MDKSWINSSKVSAEYCEGVESFLDFATNCGNSNNYLHSLVDVVRTQEGVVLLL